MIICDKREAVSYAIGDSSKTYEAKNYLRIT